VAELAQISEGVGARFDALIAAWAPRGAVAVGDRPLAQDLAELGFADPEALATRIEGWSNGRYRALRSEAARDAFARIRGALLRALAAAPDRERALLRWEQLIEHLPSAINVFRLLEARPALFDVVMRVLAHAPRLADDLARRADLLDTLIDMSAFDLPGSVDTIAGQLAHTERGDDYQCLLDAVRRKVGELRFALGVQLIEQANGALAIAASLSRVAEATIAVLTAATEAEFAAVHGTVPGSRLVILGLGRLGGGALTHASDLDLVFLFSGDFSGESDGPRPLGATLYFARLCQRVSVALSAPTAAGALYDVDTRLRPSGTQGPIAVTLDSFARYQAREAWTWEHMALCRARPVYGSAEDRAALEAIIATVLQSPRDPQVLRTDVLRMRGEMARHKPARGPLDVKLGRGGLVDAEFIVHYLQLRHRCAFDPDLGLAISALADAGLVPHAMRESHDLLERLLVVVRLVAPDGAYPPEASRAIVAAACGQRDWDSLITAIAAARALIAATWQSVFDEKLEI
jgi:glutamate-ammonia-ligase adenylyltransferase